jgi:hypothetical protein
MLWLLPLLAGIADVLAADAGPPVVGLPPGFNAGAYAPPYNGPPPSRLTRPAETFAFPIRVGAVGPSEPLFAGPRQYPFVCDTEASGLGPPLADNQAGIGTPLAADAEPASPGAAPYSQDCLAATQVWYYYLPIGANEFVRWSAAAPDVQTITINGRDVPFIVRVEIGTINRFIYVLAALKGTHESPDATSPEHWNKRLIYQFFGGVGIGHRQGKVRMQKILDAHRGQLALGYAVAASTGNSTENHYDIWLAEDTALRVKRQFAARYGAPEYTVGIGGSGGAIQQYLLAQNRPGLIDAAIAQYSYPDMITQTIPVFDCELLAYYFDVTDRGNALWRRAENRAWVEGFSANNQYAGSGRMRKFAWINGLASLVRGELPRSLDGQTECVAGWRGLTPLVLNPRFMHFKERVSDAVFRQVRWSYFEDMKAYFGTDQQGYARIPWDNVGVQYGLQALRRRQISADQFLDLNARIGSWKAPAEMQAERYWILAGGESSLHEFSPWSAHNMNRSEASGRIAPRFAGDRAAMAAAYRSGQVFLGRLDIPVIDLRHYLDPELNMHHASASFSTRARLLAAQGHAANQAIWVSDKRHDATAAALAAIDAWLAARRDKPDRSWAESRPAESSDRCFDAQGKVMFSGDQVWDGEWNQRAPGACMSAYPIFTNPRMVAGADIRGDHFKCALQSVGDAIKAGLYQPVDMAPYRAQLEAIFPQGVCDYRQPDQGRPVDLFGPLAPPAPTLQAGPLTVPESATATAAAPIATPTLPE